MPPNVLSTTSPELKIFLIISTIKKAEIAIIGGVKLGIKLKAEIKAAVNAEIIKEIGRKIERNIKISLGIKPAAEAVLEVNNNNNIFIRPCVIGLADPSGRSI